jgi:hypothetical protein
VAPDVKVTGANVMTVVHASVTANHVLVCILNEAMNQDERCWDIFR